MPKRRLWRDTLVAYLFCAPAYTVFVLFIFIPIIWALFLSFYDFNIMTFLFPDFVGLRNYQKLFTDRYFWLALKNTAVFSLMYVPISMLAGLVFALILHERFPGRNIFRLSIFIPSVISMVVASIVWMLILSPGSSGLANRFLGAFGLESRGWLSESRLAMFSIVIVMVWKDFGYNMLIYLAGLQNIPEELYQAAELDGASKLQRILKITLPLLKPTTFFLSVTTIIGSFQIFTPIYIMTGGGPGYATTTLVNYLYTKGFQEFEMGYATAISFVLFVILLGLTIVQRKLSRGSDTVM